MRWVCMCLFVMAVGGSAVAIEDPLVFNVDDTGETGEGIPRIEPWKTVDLDPECGGLWMVAGDVDGDGQVEIVSAENFNEGDVHYTSAVAAQKLDGTVLWRWGDPAIGRKNWHHDVACQIHDWDGDGKNEVVVVSKEHVVELDGATGKERRRIPIPEQASDCIVFCDLSGVGRPTDYLVKNRYQQIWAYNAAGEALWNAENPGGYRTAHQPRPMDIDGDGRDEIMAGFAMLNADGSVRWVFKSQAVDLRRGHMDCARVMKQGKTAGETLIALTCCGAENIAVVDGTGATRWEDAGAHFESLQIGHIIPDQPGPQILVDVDHLPRDKGLIRVLGPEGQHLGQVQVSYGRHHRLIDWTGDGAHEFVVGATRSLYGADGKRIAVLAVEEEGKGAYETSVLVGDMTGDGVPDVCVVTPRTAAIFKNEKGSKPPQPVPLGTGLNLTLY